MTPAERYGSGYQTGACDEHAGIAEPEAGYPGVQRPRPRVVRLVGVQAHAPALQVEVIPPKRHQLALAESLAREDAVDHSVTHRDVPTRHELTIFGRVQVALGALADDGREPPGRDRVGLEHPARVQTGAIVLWDHATDELRKDGMTPVDATNVLRCGRIYEEAEQRGAAWRYRVHTDRMCVVVQFEGADELAIVTAWRKGR